MILALEANEIILKLRDSFLVFLPSLWWEEGESRDAFSSGCIFLGLRLLIANMLHKLKVLLQVMFLNIFLILDI